MRNVAALSVLAVSALVLGLCASTACAQDAPPERRTWAHLSVGTSAGDRAAGMVSLHHLRGPHHGSLRLAGAFDSALGTESQSDIALLYGPALSWSWGMASVQGGLALTMIETNEGVAGIAERRQETSRTVPGLPLQATVYLTPPIGVGGIGLKVGGFASVNEERSFAGVTVGLVVGALR